MTTQSNKKNDDIEISSLISEVVKKTIGEINEGVSHDDAEIETLNEAYVSTPKKFGMPAEYLSQKTKDSHVQLYESYVNTLNEISAQLDADHTLDANSNLSAHQFFKFGESKNLNAVWLHELYFAASFDPHSNISINSKAYMRIERDFGTFDDWQRDFLASCMSVGEGWVVFGYNTYLRRYVNTLITEHSHNVMLGLQPIIVIDMWSHSYYKDYLNDKKNYVLQSMQGIDWAVVEDRINVAEKIALSVGGQAST